MCATFELIYLVTRDVSSRINVFEFSNWYKNFGKMQSIAVGGGRKAEKRKRERQNAKECEISKCGFLEAFTRTANAWHFAINYSPEPS